MGLLGIYNSVDYAAVKKCLKKQYTPPGVELEWQWKLHTVQQKQAESQTEFLARLHMLANRPVLPYQSWKAKELAHNQFMHGILSPSIQLKLLQEQSNTSENAITLASLLELVSKGKAGSVAHLIVAASADSLPLLLAWLVATELGQYSAHSSFWNICPLEVHPFGES